MERIGEYMNYEIYWSDPKADGGNGTGEVMVGTELAGYANTQEEAMKVAKQWIADYDNKLNR